MQISYINSNLFFVLSLCISQMEESKDFYAQVDALFRRKRKTEKKKEENLRRRILRSLGFGLGLETFANFWRVSVSVLENLVSEKSLGFREFGLGKKVSVSVSENWVSEEKSWYWFRSKFWYRHSVFAIDEILRYR